MVVTTVSPSGGTRALQGGTACHLESLLVGQRARDSIMSHEEGDITTSLNALVI